MEDEEENEEIGLKLKTLDSSQIAVLLSLGDEFVHKTEGIEVVVVVAIVCCSSSLSQQEQFCLPSSKGKRVASSALFAPRVLNAISGLSTS